MKKLAIILFFIPIISFGQGFVPFGADSLWLVNSYNDSSYASGVFTIKEINSNLYVGAIGNIHMGGDIPLYGVGYWDTQQWNSLNNGFYPESVDIHDIIKYKNCIYFGNSCGIGIDGASNSGYLSGWDGIQWLSNPEQIHGDVRAMAVLNDTLFFGGGFHSIGTESLNYINVAAFNGTNFIKVGSLSGTCVSMVTFNNEVYASGSFGFKKYVGGTGYEAWVDVVSAQVQTMQVDTFNNLLYLIYPQYVDTLQTNGIAIYDGFAYSNMGGVGTEWAPILDMIEYRGDYYGKDGNYDSLVKWDDVNKTWVQTSLLNMAVVDFAVYDNMLYIGGFHRTPYWGCMDSTDYGIARYFIPEDSISACAYLKPRVQSYTDTFNVNQTAQLYNNNAYADTWQWDFGDTGTANIKDPSHVFTQVGTYTVSVTVTHGTCSVTAEKDIVVVLGAGIKEILQKESGFILYPNPTSNNLQLVINNEQLKGENIEILNVNGKVIKNVIASKAWQSQTDSHERSSRYDAISIDVSQLTSGTYFVKIGNETVKFVKE